MISNLFSLDTGPKVGAFSLVHAYITAVDCRVIESECPLWSRQESPNTSVRFTTQSRAIWNDHLFFALDEPKSL